MRLPFRTMFSNLRGASYPGVYRTFIRASRHTHPAVRLPMDAAALPVRMFPHAMINIGVHQLRFAVQPHALLLRAPAYGGIGGALTPTRKRLVMSNALKQDGQSSTAMMQTTNGPIVLSALYVALLPNMVSASRAEGALPHGVSTTLSMESAIIPYPSPRAVPKPYVLNAFDITNTITDTDAMRLDGAPNTDGIPFKFVSANTGQLEIDGRPIASLEDTAQLALSGFTRLLKKRKGVSIIALSETEPAQELLTGLPETVSFLLQWQDNAFDLYHVASLQTAMVTLGSLQYGYASSILPASGLQTICAAMPVRVDAALGFMGLMQGCAPLPMASPEFLTALSIINHTLGPGYTQRTKSMIQNANTNAVAGAAVRMSPMPAVSLRKAHTRSMVLSLSRQVSLPFGQAQGMPLTPNQEETHAQYSGLSMGASYLRSEILSASQSPERWEQAAIRLQQVARGHQVRKNTGNIDVYYQKGWLSSLLLRVADGIKNRFPKMSGILIQFAEQVALGRQGHRHLTTLRDHYSDGAKVTVLPVVSADLQQQRVRPGAVVITVDELEGRVRSLSSRRKSH